MVVYRALNEVLRSWSNVAVLRSLLDSDSGFSGREVARVSGMSIRSALQALTSLEQLGLVRRQRGGRDHLFTLNRDHFLVEKGILPLFATEQQFVEEIKSVLASALQRKTVSAVIFGSVARQEETPQSDLDLCCIVKNKSQQAKVEETLDAIGASLRRRFGVKLGPVYFTVDEFRKKAKRKNPLIREILDDGKLIVGKNPKMLVHA